MSRLIISSKVPNAVFNKPIKIILDGNEVCKINPNEKKELDLSPGSHSFYCTLDWGSSSNMHLNLLDDEIKCFTINQRVTFKSIMKFTLVLFIFTVLLRIYFRVDLIQFSILPYFIYLILNATIMRKSFYVLKEESLF